jgi:hypothetical protein
VVGTGSEQRGRPHVFGIMAAVGGNGRSAKHVTGWKRLNML